SVVAEAALHVRDESEVLRNSLLAEDLPDARHVSARTLQALLEALARTARELVDPGEDATVHGHRDVEPLFERADARLGRGGQTVGDIGHGRGERAVDRLFLLSGGVFRIGRLAGVGALRTVVRGGSWRSGRAQFRRRCTSDCEHQAGREKLAEAHWPDGR